MATTENGASGRSAALNGLNNRELDYLRALGLFFVPLSLGTLGRLVSTNATPASLARLIERRLVQTSETRWGHGNRDTETLVSLTKLGRGNLSLLSDGTSTPRRIPFTVKPDTLRWARERAVRHLLDQLLITAFGLVREDVALLESISSSPGRPEDLKFRGVVRTACIPTLLGHLSNSNLITTMDPRAAGFSTRSSLPCYQATDAGRVVLIKLDIAKAQTESTIPIVDDAAVALFVKDDRTVLAPATLS